MLPLNAPPLQLPGEHFVAAWFFFLCGVAGIVWTAPDLAHGVFLSPHVAGVTHLFTLGWITTSIMGALYQFLPVALGRSIRSQRLAHVTFALYVPGLALFIAGLLLARPAILLTGVALFGTGVLLFIGNLAATLSGATRRDVTWWALLCATFFLLLTLLLGSTLAGNQRWGYLGAHRMLALGVHIHIALAGWVLLVMTGVAHRLLPMFLLSHGASERFAKAAVALITTGVLLLAALHHLGPPLGTLLPAAFIAAGVISFLLQARAFYAVRHRPALDPGMRLAAYALGMITVALVLAWPVLLRNTAPNFAVAYVMCAVLGISLFVCAHYYKIVPFLIWFHRYGSMTKRPAGIQRVSDLYSAPMAFTAGALLTAGVAGTAAGVAFGLPVWTRAAALVLCSGAATQAWQMLQLARSHP
jgi:hypothetical protein